MLGCGEYLHVKTERTKDCESTELWGIYLGTREGQMLKEKSELSGICDRIVHVSIIISQPVSSLVFMDSMDWTHTVGSSPYVLVISPGGFRHERNKRSISSQERRSILSSKPLEPRSPAE